MKKVIFMALVATTSIFSVSAQQVAEPNQKFVPEPESWHREPNWTSLPPAPMPIQIPVPQPNISNAGQQVNVWLYQQPVVPKKATAKRPRYRTVATKKDTLFVACAMCARNHADSLLAKKDGNAGSTTAAMLDFPAWFPDLLWVILSLAIIAAIIAFIIWLLRQPYRYCSGGNCTNCKNCQGNLPFTQTINMHPSPVPPAPPANLFVVSKTVPPTLKEVATVLKETGGSYRSYPDGGYGFDIPPTIQPVVPEKKEEKQTEQ